MPSDLATEDGVPVRPRGSLGSFDVTAAVLALLLAAFVVVGASYHATDSASWFAASPGAVLGSVLGGLGLAVLLYLGIRLAYGWLDRRWAARPDPDASVIPMRRALRRWFLPTFGVVLLGWLAWLAIHYPGSVDSDTITQLFQWLGLAAKIDHHPWFDTIVFGWFFDLGAGDYGAGLFTFLVVQVTGTALGMALALTYLGRLGLPAAARWVLTVVVAVLPPFPILVTAMSKDTFAAIFWLPFLVLFVEALRTRGRFLTRPGIGAAAILLTIPLILAKRTNVYVVVLCLVVLLLVAAWRTRWRVALGAAVVLAVTNVVWPHVVLPALGVAPGTLTDTLSVPVQQTARTVVQHGPEIPPEERAVIDAVLRYEGLGAAYQPRRSDPIKGRWNDDATREQKLAYARVWFAQLQRYPTTYLGATANNTYEYFAPLTALGGTSDLNLPRYYDYWRSRSFAGTTPAQIEAVAGTIYPAPALAPVRTAVNRTAAVVMTGNLLTSKALYCSWIPLLALGFALRRRSWLLALATVPLFLNLAVLVAGPIALPRYMIPMLLGSVLLVGLMLVPARWLPRRPPAARPEQADAAATDEARDTATRLLGTPVTGVVRLAGSVANQDYRVDRGAEPSVVMKRGPEEEIAREAWVLSRLAELDVPAPSVVHPPDPGPPGAAVLILSLVPGTAAATPAVVRAAGAAMRRVHQVRLPGFGPLVSVDGQWRGRYDSWAEAMAATVGAGPDLVAAGVLDADLARQAAQLIPGPLVDFSGAGVLLHRDLKEAHLLGADDDLTGILDWGDAWVGDPLLDLARMSMAPAPVFAAFLEGYGTALPADAEDRLAAYRVSWDLDALGYEHRAGGDWFDVYRTRLAADLQRLTPSPVA